MPAITEWLRRRALRNGPLISGISLQRLQEAGQPHCEVVYRVETNGPSAGFVALSNAWSTALRVDAAAAVALGYTRVDRGWGVHVGRSSIPVELRFRCLWEGDEIDVPGDVPFPVRDDSAPLPIVPVVVAPPYNGLVLTGLKANEQGDGYVNLAITRGPAVRHRTPALRAVELQFLDVNASTTTALEVELAMALVLRSLERLAQRLPTELHGSIGITVVDSGTWFFSRRASRVHVAREWLAATYPPHVAAINVMWQLTALWWGGLTRLNQADGSRDMLALRLLTLSSVCREERAASSSPPDVAVHLARAAAAELRGVAASADRTWFDDAIALGVRMATRDVQDARISHIARRALTLAHGCESDARWLQKQFEEAGVGFW